MAQLELVAAPEGGTHAQRAGVEEVPNHGVVTCGAQAGGHLAGRTVVAGAHAGGEQQDP